MQSNLTFLCVRACASVLCACAFTRLYDEVSELANGMRVLRVNGEVFSSYDTHNGRLGDEYARMTVHLAAGWRRVAAGGERPMRVLLLGLGGGSMVSGLHHRCQGRSTRRHRRASTGKGTGRGKGGEGGTGLLTSHSIDRVESPQLFCNWTSSQASRHQPMSCVMNRARACTSVEPAAFDRASEPTCIGAS